MAHIGKNKKKITDRISRLQGQLNAVAHAVSEGNDCVRVLQTLAACKGALNGLMGEILEDHIREHLQVKQNEEDCSELIGILKSYLK